MASQFPHSFCPKKEQPNLERKREGDTMFAAAVKHAKSTPSLGRDRIAGKPIFPKLGQQREIQNSLHLLRSSVPSRRVWALFKFDWWRNGNTGEGEELPKCFVAKFDGFYLAYYILLFGWSSTSWSCLKLSMLSQIVHVVISVKHSSLSLHPSV